MKPSQELVFALRRAAKRIIDPKEKYIWLWQEHCNCGILVQALCGYSASEVRKELRDTGMDGSWTGVGYLCFKTGFPHSFIFDTLQAVGFEAKDFEFIEHAGQSKNTPPEKCQWGTPQYVHDFFLSLADDLEIQLTGKIESRNETGEEITHRRTISETVTS